MTKEQKKKILRLARLRKKAGERAMIYDEELTKEFEKLGVDLGAFEGGTNSVFLITEPSYCERVIHGIVKDLERSDNE